VARQVGSGGEGRVLGDTKVNQVGDLGQDEKVPSHRILNLGELIAEVLGKDFVQASTEFDRLLANELEALIERTKDVLRDERARLQRFFYVWVLHHGDDFIKDFVGSFAALPQIAK
jgi:hypothetical protein